MAALLSENCAQHNGALPEDKHMHPALHSWREQLPSAFVRTLAYFGGVALLSMAAARLFQSPPATSTITPVHQSEWIDIERPFPAFALSIPEAADVPASYAIRRHAEGGGRKDSLELGEPDSGAPYLRVEVYRPGAEIRRFADPKVEIVTGVGPLGPVEVRRADETLASKFGPLTIFFFATSTGTPRNCLGFVRTYIDPHDCNCPAGFAEGVTNSSSKARGLCTRPVDAAGRRERVKNPRAVRAGRTEPKLLRPARSDSGGNAEVSPAVESYGKLKRTAPHRAVTTSAIEKRIPVIDAPM